MTTACVRSAAWRWTGCAVAVALLGAAPLGAQGGAHSGALDGALQSSTTTRALKPSTTAFRVCADPNNLPFSNRAGDGFENRIARVLAADLGLPVTYTWWAQRRGFIRSTLGAGLCDVVIGIVAGDEQVATTAPYYRSTYVFVSRRARNLRISSFDDPRLRTMRVGIHVIGDDYNSLPPGVALARRGLVRNVVGYSIYGNYAQPSPPAKLIQAVARGDVDVAVVWGPLAGYYAARSRVPLTLTPVRNAFATPGIPFTYAIAIGVRHRDTALRARLDRALVRHRATVQRILARYGIPVISPSPTSMSTTAARVGRSCKGTAEERTCA